MGGGAPAEIDRVRPYLLVFAGYALLIVAGTWQPGFYKLGLVATALGVLLFIDRARDRKRLAVHEDRRSERDVPHQGA